MRTNNNMQEDNQLYSSQNQGRWMLANMPTHQTFGLNEQVRNPQNQHAAHEQYDDTGLNVDKQVTFFAGSQQPDYNQHGYNVNGDVA